MRITAISQNFIFNSLRVSRTSCPPSIQKSAGQRYRCRIDRYSRSEVDLHRRRLEALRIRSTHDRHKLRLIIVTLPNFGHWSVRWQLGVGGRMPVSKRLPYQWYDTPNVHFSTITDFDVFCAEKGISVQRRAVLAGGKAISVLPNLRGETAVFQIERQ